MIYDDQYFEDEYDGFYDEPSEYEQMVEDLKDKLKETVKKEILDELQQLRRKVADLQDLKNNWNQRCRDQAIEHGRAMRELEEIKRNLRRTRASELLQEFPAVDAVPVVRCKDCRYWRHEVDTHTHWVCTMYSFDERLIHTTPDFFCAGGLRRDDNVDGKAR